MITKEKVMKRIAAGCVCLMLSGPLFADQLKVPVGDQGDMDTSRPASGMSTDMVEQKFGSPVEISGPVGDLPMPPITIWRYKTFSVYFEYDKVIHTVLHKA